MDSDDILSDAFSNAFSGMFGPGMVPPKYEGRLSREDRIENRIRVNNYILRRLSRHDG